MMKNWFFYFSFLVLIFSGANAAASDCKVNDPDIASEYSGECKNGLANGNGTAKGRDVYVGGFRNGLEHGKGTYIWKNSGRLDNYKGDWVDGGRTGKGKLVYDCSPTSGCDVYEGDSVNGIANGFGVQTYRCNCGFAFCERCTKKGIWENGNFVTDADSIQDYKNNLAREKAQHQKENTELNNILNQKNPQLMYLAAGKYERNGASWKARQIYERLIDRFPSSQWAAKANDQLLQNQRVDTINSESSRATSEAKEQTYKMCKIEEQSCYNREGKNCYRDCNSLR